MLKTPSRIFRNKSIINITKIVQITPLKSCLVDISFWIFFYKTTNCFLSQEVKLYKVKRCFYVLIFFILPRSKLILSSVVKFILIKIKKFLLFKFLYNNCEKIFNVYRKLVMVCPRANLCNNCCIFRLFESTKAPLGFSLYTQGDCSRFWINTFYRVTMFDRDRLRHIWDYYNILFNSSFNHKDAYLQKNLSLSNWLEPVKWFCYNKWCPFKF